MRQVISQTPHTQLELGYRFHSGQHPGHIGYGSLGVVLHGAPTRQQFDPVRVSVHIVSTKGDDPIKHLTVHHNWHGDRQYRVCAGRVMLDDRENRTVEAFTFGGSLTLHPSDDYTTITLSSSAPILDLTHESVYPPTLSLLLATRVEGEMAARRSYWDHLQPGEYERRLAAASANPHQFYQVAVLTLEKKVRTRSQSDENSLWQFEQWLHSEARRIRKEVGESIPPLSTIL